MNRALAHLVLADIRERVRRTSFLLILTPAVYLGYTVHAGFWTMRHGAFRAEFSTAYVGAMTALLSGMVLSLFGFYLVKSAVAQDRTTGVGQILATTPMRAAWYTVAKAVGNFMVLSTMVAVLAGAAWLVVVVGDETQIDWSRQLLGPFLLLALPMMAVTAAAAVLFETIPLLKSGFGNVVWLLVWAVLPAAAIQTNLSWLDLSGLSAVRDSLIEAQHLSYPDEPVNLISLNAGPAQSEPRTFPWQGIQWTSSMIAQRCSWFVIGFLVSLLAAIPFDRFDPTRARWRLRSTWRNRRSDFSGEPAHLGLEVWESDRETSNISSTVAAFIPALLSRKPETKAPSFSAVRLPAAEFRLLLGGHPTAWYFGGLGLLIAQIAAPLELVHRHVLPFVWIWPLLVWSRMGTLSRQHGTEALLNAAPRPILRQLPATWVAGVAIALLASAPAILRLAISGLINGSADLAAGGSGGIALIAGAFFVSSLALALGTWSGTPRLFEVVYLVLWYVGPLSGAAPLDFLGVTSHALAIGTPSSFGLWSLPLVVAAALGRLFRFRQ